MVDAVHKNDINNRFYAFNLPAAECRHHMYTVSSYMTVQGLKRKPLFTLDSLDLFLFFSFSLWHQNVHYVKKYIHLPLGVSQSDTMSCWQAKCNHRDHLCCCSQQPFNVCLSSSALSPLSSSSSFPTSILFSTSHFLSFLFPSSLLSPHLIPVACVSLLRHSAAAFSPSFLSLSILLHRSTSLLFFNSSCHFLSSSHTYAPPFSLKSETMWFPTNFTKNEKWKATANEKQLQRKMWFAWCPKK